MCTRHEHIYTRLLYVWPKARLYTYIHIYIYISLMLNSNISLSLFKVLLFLHYIYIHLSVYKQFISLSEGTNFHRTCLKWIYKNKIKIISKLRRIIHPHFSYYYYYYISSSYSLSLASILS